MKSNISFSRWWFLQWYDFNLTIQGHFSKKSKSRINNALRSIESKTFPNYAPWVFDVFFNWFLEKFGKFVLLFQLPKYDNRKFFAKSARKHWLETNITLDCYFAFGLKTRLLKNGILGSFFFTWLALLCFASLYYNRKSLAT